MYHVSVLKHKGFSLIELMIVVAIVAIIASVALPSYFSSVERSRRAEGKAFLLDFAARQEREYTIRSRYATTAELGALPNRTSENRLYVVGSADAVVGNDQTFILSAVPQWNQTLVCGNLTLSNTGVRAVTGDADADGLVTPNDTALCWR